LNGAAMGKDLVDFNRDAAGATNTGQAIVAIDPAAFGEIDAFKREVDRLVRDLRSSERMPGVERIFLPGEQSHEKRRLQAAHGITIAPQVHKTLNDLASELGIASLGE